MADKQLELRGVAIHYGEFTAADNVSLSLEQGEIGCLLGPSGCGKTTLLRAIAGFEPLTSGEISLRGRSLSNSNSHVPPEQRQVGMVFQDFALFPHLTVQRNVAFGLQKMAAGERQQRVQQMLELVGLAPLASRYPHDLSGGQQQRVALARALAPGPELLLLDEPFSSLDAQLRESLATEVRQLLKSSGVTAILVTHDQQEAFAMADQITLLREGKVAQSGTPEALYREPASEFVARFLGPGSVLTVSADNPSLRRAMELDETTCAQQPQRVLVRPDAVFHAPESGTPARITARTFRGAQTLYQLCFEDNQEASCLVSGHQELDVGDPFVVSFDRDRLIFLDA